MNIQDHIALNTVNLQQKLVEKHVRQKHQRKEGRTLGDVIAFTEKAKQEEGPESGVYRLPGGHRGGQDKRFVGFVKTNKGRRRRKKLQAFGGEPSAGGLGTAHYSPVPTFHPPSLKNPRRVPADNPKEDDDRFGDVTKRNARDTIRKRLLETRRNANPPGLPAQTTAVEHHQGYHLPFATTGVY